MAPATVPRAVELFNFNVPDEIVVAPVKVFEPDKVHTPASCLVKVPEVVPKILVNVPP